MYRPITGPSTVFTTVVLVLSGSKISGKMTLEIVTIVPGSCASRISFIRRSFVPST